MLLILKVAIFNGPASRGPPLSAGDRNARVPVKFSSSVTARGALSPLLLLPEYLRVGLAIGIKAITFTAFPSGSQFGRRDVPVWTAFPQHSTQVLPKLFDGRPAKKPVAVVDFEY